jgi:hypothetical protein
MQKKQVDNLENVIPFDAETRETPGEDIEFVAEMPFEAFDRLVSQYYYAKSLEQDTSSLEFAQDLAKSSEELAFTILTKCISEPRHVLSKLNILENELATELENGEPFDGKYLVMFAGLKADVIRLAAQVEAV